VDQPLNAQRRPLWPAVLVVLAIVALVGVVVALVI
jgi:hypothetical protein